MSPLPSEITPRTVYARRREFIKSSIGLGLAAALPTAPVAAENPFATTEPPTPLKLVAGYNNFVEFGFDKESPARLAGALRIRPWQIAIDGLVKKPMTLDLDAIHRLAPHEERIYRLRCVEGWSMVIPWLGFPLDVLLRQVEPLGSAKYIALVSAVQADTMPSVGRRNFPWPYSEGLRLDEARHPLTLLAAGLYGDPLPNQNGAPLRIVVPWKYGFKSAKSIVAIHFLEHPPATSWNTLQPGEYGFYANVNPAVSHPRWSQAKERRIGEFFKRDTLPFNGYGDQVAALYAGMDLRKHY